MLEDVIIIYGVMAAAVGVFALIDAALWLHERACARRSRRRRRRGDAIL